MLAITERGSPILVVFMKKTRSGGVVSRLSHELTASSHSEQNRLCIARYIRSLGSSSKIQILYRILGKPCATVSEPLTNPRDIDPSRQPCQVSVWQPIIGCSVHSTTISRILGAGGTLNSAHRLPRTCATRRLGPKRNVNAPTGYTFNAHSCI